MGEKLDEGLLYDLFTKRRAGKFTGDELLWAADHPEFIRWAMARPKVVAGVKRLLFPSATIAAEYGYTVVEDVEPTLKSAADLEAVPFLEPDDNGRVSGETMRVRAKKRNANLGLADLKVALADRANIPEEARSYYIVFSGTLLRGQYGRLYVACLCRGDDRWFVDFLWVACDWRDCDRLARCK